MGQGVGKRADRGAGNGRPGEAPQETVDAGDTGKQLERVRWFLWHGNVQRALETLEDIEDALDVLSQEGESRRKLGIGE